jgi:hypothetical protein
MGYCYETRTGSLCCDICGNAGARKNKCPHGWCQPVACCMSEKCKATLKEHRRTTCAVGCKKAHADMVARDAVEAARLAAGEWLRCSALSEQKLHNCVKVWFRNAAKAELIRYMPHATYDAFPLCEPVSVEQYAAVGGVAMEAF